MPADNYDDDEESQSLWVRDRFLIVSFLRGYALAQVAIPLGQGQVFNTRQRGRCCMSARSQSLWVRDRFLIRGRTRQRIVPRRNPFGSGTGF